MLGVFLISGGGFDDRLKTALQIIQKTAPNHSWKPENNPDYFLVETEPSVGIEEIRLLQEKIKLKPFGQTIKVVLFPKAENLTLEAQNAFLKTLEEPPGETLIILCAPDSLLLLPTISSRCQLISLPSKSRVALSEKEFQNFEKIFHHLIASQIGERFLVIEQQKLAADRQLTISWLEKMIFLVRSFLINRYLKKESIRGLTSLELLLILRSLLKTKFYLQANANTRLALEVFLLDLPQSTC